MNRSLVDQIAAAVLYEGYILYPYRPSVKNRQRWTFGGVYPRAWAEANCGDAWAMRTECPITADRDAELSVRVRFLQLMGRTVGELQTPLSHWPAEGQVDYRAVEKIQIGDRLFQTWQEATEREIAIDTIRLGDLVDRPHRQEFMLPASRTLEPLRDSAGTIVGVLDRRQYSICGAIELSASIVGDGDFTAAVQIENVTPINDLDREACQLRALVSTHTILNVRDGAFVSLTDPPANLHDAAAACRNIGCWPVLVGNEGDADTVLSSPIILPDYPQIAPESPGDLFDGTEIDEILTLRILTLTEDEKRSALGLDPRAKEMLERTERLARDQLLGLHGTVRGLRRIAEETAHG